MDEFFLGPVVASRKKNSSSTMWIQRGGLLADESVRRPFLNLGAERSALHSKTVSDGIKGKFKTIRHLQLLKDVCQVCLDGLLTDK